MKTNDILQLDCRKEENQEIIQKVLRKIKPLSSCADDTMIPLEKLEKLIMLIGRKYDIGVGCIFQSYQAAEKTVLYSTSILQKQGNDFRTLCNIYGISLYEITAKAAIKMYACTKQND